MCRFSDSRMASTDHAAEDKLRKEEAEVRNTADTLVYQTEKQLREYGDQLTDDEKNDVESKLAALKEQLSGEDLEALKGATEALMTASQGYAQRMYEAAAQDAAAEEGGDVEDDEIVDAEIIDEDEES